VVRLYDGHTLVPSIRRAGWSGAGDEAVHKNDTIKSCAFHSQSRMGVVQEVRLYDGHTLVLSIRRAGWSGAGNEAVHKNENHKIMCISFAEQDGSGAGGEAVRWSHTRFLCHTRLLCQEPGGEAVTRMKTNTSAPVVLAGVGWGWCRR